MNLSAGFIKRPVATTLLTAGVALAGVLAFGVLPVAPLPQIDFPAVSVTAMLPGASPEIMASSVAAPLERQFGRISGLAEMTSISTLGQTNVVLLFDLSRDPNAAARDVEAAINAARSNLPSNLPANPTYRLVNPADTPILIIALTSDTVSPGGLYDAASTILEQKLSQIQGVGQIIVGGSSLPAVRIDVNPTALNGLGLQLENIRTAVAAQTLNRPKGTFSRGRENWSIDTDDQLLHAAQYRSLIVGYHNGAPVRLGKVANVQESVEDVHSLALANGRPAALLVVMRQPGANVIQTVQRIDSALPGLRAALGPGIRMNIMLDLTTTIRASVHDVERTLVIAFFLVVLVVFMFLRDARSTFIPSVAIAVSLLGTCCVMYLLGYSIDNFSLMALTISTGFVIDDAVVVLENIGRYREMGLNPTQAALKGAEEVGFTVLSMSMSLVAVFIPILFMGGLVGRLFREFAVTLAITIVVSMFVSLTTTPMMASRFMKESRRHGAIYHAADRSFVWMLAQYRRSLRWALDHSGLVLAIAFVTLGLNLLLFVKVRKGFFPEEDTGVLMGTIQGQQDISFEAMKQRILHLMQIVNADPSVAGIAGFTGGGAQTTTNTARVFVALKPLDERHGTTAQQIIARLRPKLATVPGATLYLQAMQDVRLSGRRANAEYQYSLQDENLNELDHWAPLFLEKMQELSGLAEVSSDQQNGGLQASLAIDRVAASRLGITPQLIDSTLYDAFGQRQIATLYTPLNQYHVVMSVAPQFWQYPNGLQDIYLAQTGGVMIPLSAFTRYSPSIAPLAVNHQGQFPSVTVSFNLAPGASLGQAVAEIDRAKQEINLPASIHGGFAGTAEAFQTSAANELLLVVGALGAVYVVLGILYESYIHPFTILSTLPSAGVGALLALWITHTELTVIAIIAILLLIGIVKKNAIMMVDFALQTERRDRRTTPEEAIFEASLLRFRPIMMTTMAALLGAMPLAFDTGMGSELRRPLGIAIIGGLVVSQILTLYTTPVIYLYMDRLRLWLQGLGTSGPETESAQQLS